MSKLTPSNEQPPVWRLVAGVFLTGQIMVVGLAVNLGEATPLLAASVHIALLIGTVIVAMLVGSSLGGALIRSFKRRRASFDWLFATAIAGSLAHSFAGVVTGGPVYFEVTALLFVVHALGERANHSRRAEAIDRTRDLLADPEHVWKVTCCGSVKRLPLGEARVDDLLRVSEGEIVPVDGLIENGIGWLNEAWWSGESLPRTRGVGDTVLAGSRVIDGTLTIKTSAALGTRQVDQVRQRVAEARERPSAIQRTTDELARWMLPAVALVASGTFVFWTYRTSMSVGWLHAMAVLLVACPCAMGFATPVAFWVALRDLASRGLLVRSGETIERLARVDVAIFDKTGVLTDPDIVLDTLAVLPGEPRDEILAAIHTLERSTSHPVARAIAAGTRDWRDPALSVRNMQMWPGRGIEGDVIGLAGSHHFLIGRFDADMPDDQLAVFRDGRLVATLEFGETVRPHVHSLGTELSSLGIDLMTLTGDRLSRAQKLGLPVRADLLPQQKHDAVVEAAASGHRVLFVGDGINDAAAMAESYVSIVAADGASLPHSIADAVWLGRDLDTLVGSIRIAKNALSVVRSNIAFAAFYNLLGMSAAAAGLLHPGWAAILMTGSSFLVTLRSGAYESKFAERGERKGAARGPAAAVSA